MRVYANQFTPAKHITENDWRPSLDDLAIYGAHGDAVRGISAPSDEHRTWVKQRIADAILIVEACVFVASVRSLDE